MRTEPYSESEQAVVRDHVQANREQLRRAFTAVVRACRGRLVGDVAIGMDPDGDPLTRWWARVQLQGGRAGRTVLVEGFPSALHAVDALGERVAHVLRHGGRA